MENGMPPEVISIAEARTMSGLGITTLYKLIGQGRLQTAKLGRRRLVRVDSIRALIAECQVGA